ncbi:hypothetical protein [Thalassovita gelatinovora]|uniref:hypothetical protein n=1 Tax=Thalassovita gelatinovora TaxID=53501 RepID=UPI00071CF04C|nr:hypothetical protein [Thalassovita gelatinovora]QIZ80684.1 hypothetical protein HFZ77_09430 [Thalassovita gelatinovora]
MRIVWAWALLGLLSGCLAPGPQDDAGAAVKTGLHRAELAGGDVVIVPPQGYCIQQETLHSRATGGFALLASCETITGYVSGYDVDPMVLTITAVPRRSEAAEPDVEEIAAALGDRKVLRRLHGDGLTIVQVMATESLTTEDDPRHWRAMMVLNGKMVGLALYGPKGSAMSGEKGLTMLSWQAERLREESPLMVRGGGPVPEAMLRPHVRPGTGIEPGVGAADASAEPIERPKPEPENDTAKGGGVKKLIAGLFQRRRTDKTMPEQQE